MPISRRTFLAASMAAAASPAWGAVPASGNVDVVIVGAGAAGIAAARRLAASKTSFAIVEAARTVGGRCITDVTTFGMPFDRGANRIHAPDVNRLAQLAASVGLDVYGAPPGMRMRIGRRYAREGEMENYLAGLVRARRAIEDASRKADGSCAQVIPRDLGDWRQSIDFALGPYATGKGLSELSTQDVARRTDTDMDAFCRVGYGALLARLAGGLDVQLSTPANRISWSGRTGVEVETERGKLTARAAIVTVSTGVLGAGHIRFAPELPRRLLDAVSKLSLGSFDHIALELPGNPLGLQRDDMLFEQATDLRTAGVLGNVYGSTLCMVDVGGRFGRELSAQGEPAMVDFALTWLTGLYGNDLRKAVGRSAATRWNTEPLVLGAASAAAPGAHAMRKVLMEPLNGRMWFAGEAAHETQWGSVNGAWESGDRAAGEVIKQLRGGGEPAQKKRRSSRRNQN